MSVLDAKSSNPREGGPSFPLSHRLFRAVWNVTWAVTASWTPVPLHVWRRMVLKAFGAKVSPSARVYPGVKIWYPPNLTLGNHAVIGPGVILYDMDRMEIGDYAIVSQRAHLCGGTHDPDDPHFQLQPKPIVIGAKAWVAAEAFVGPGVTLGEGAVLGARGCAFKDLAPWTIHGGNPAKFIRERAKF